MRYAIYSDTHSNLEALTTFLNYSLSHHIDHYWMLGDIVGYGANPQQVSDKVFEISNIVIQGNHDKAIVDDALLEWFNDAAKQALLWTRTQLDSQTKEKLAHLPPIYIHKNITLAHGSPDRPEEFPYIDEWEEASKAFKAFKTPICFVGHTHLPQIFSERKKISGYLKEGTYQLSRDDRYIISCGSVGQPRDMDTRLSFGIYDDKNHTIELVRLPYAKEEAAKKIRVAGLPRFFADRLL